MITPSENPALAIQRRNRLSESCFEAIVSAADLVYETPRGSQDYAGTDYTIEVPTAIDAAGGPVMSVQLKSVGEESSTFRRLAGAFAYDIDAKTHDRLVHTRLVPMVLVLVVFPKRERWLEVDDAKVIMMCTPYLISLAGRDPSGNTSSKAVHFTSDNRLDPGSLLEFVDKIRPMTS